MIYVYKLTSKGELVKLSLISSFKPFSFDNKPVIRHLKTDKFLDSKGANNPMNAL